MKFYPGDLVRTNLVAQKRSRDCVDLVTTFPGSEQSSTSVRGLSNIRAVSGKLHHSDIALVISTTNDSRMVFVICPHGAGFVFGALLKCVVLKCTIE